MTALKYFAAKDSHIISRGGFGFGEDIKRVTKIYVTEFPRGTSPSDIPVNGAVTVEKEKKPKEDI